MTRRPKYESGSTLATASHLRRPLEFADKSADAALEASERKLEMMAARLLLAEREERQRIADGLHDDAGQNLAVLKVKLASLRRTTPGTAVDELIELVDEVIGTTRTLTFDLSSPVLDRLGLVAAIHNELDRIFEQHGIASHVETKVDRRLETIAPELQILLFCGVRELLRNVARHSGASTLRVSVRTFESELEISLADDGVGFDTQSRLDPLAQGNGFGIFSISRAMGHADGSLDIESFPGKGTRAVLRAPLETQAQEREP